LSKSLVPLRESDKPACPPTYLSLETKPPIGTVPTAFAFIGLD